ncbi:MULTISPECIES: dihydrolipoyl dehydrogenase [Stenotrophomonas]|jgi:dihydrolipoamide dehydrogenase|uniref:dihydrolipoyl dehydrogenase n=1 Tax=Stenotrophomonas TaxID=40323 RepID=UPI00062132B3|nr:MULTISPECIES: dihydrolipoyl dehydrogenase [Stenotrophomonas]AWT14836.1 dihydrolipoyl dehydrogenase [Stenotrophomonas maltophilia]KKF87912.1 dihydrolipoamide dehydrogenase [Stenotrophomonas maltophilia]MBA0258060.1 dihydrolipoyl dehydrogenase [Stenotrophomonas maltophilia]MBA0434335.1 dihydrolipoyl dehydrogenase [Stenotrophomonas maltophilia]MBA0454278.1 dihydrolipoyl dehydrogenase [Stenotrophomonas maltophilia]
MSEHYDVVIIGGGPGGYPAAIRAAQLGLRVACIESRQRLGGTCLNVGCIPSKALLESSERFIAARTEFAEHGVEFEGLRLNLLQLMTHKDNVVSGLGNGIDFLMRKHKIARLVGTGSIPAPGQVTLIDSNGATQTLTATSIVIATGSDSATLSGVPIDEARIVSSTGALALPEVPKHLVVIGAGYVGLELGSVWRRLGANVTVIEYLDRVTSGMDIELSQALHKVLEEQGFVFRLSQKVTGARSEDDEIVLTVEPAQGGPSEEIRADYVLVSIGRRPFTDGLGLDAIGITRDRKGYIQVDEHWRTNVDGIYAIGDVIGGPMLAHKATEEGVALAEQLAGLPGHVNYGAIPAVVYTAPEVASVGQTEEALKAAGVSYKVGRFPFSANSRARAKAQTDGFVKILADATTDRVLGVHIIGPEAGSLIHEAVVAMEFHGSAEDIARSCHAHPTLPEALKEAAMAVDNWALHV